ncbi:MAG: glyoxalase [Acidimicrobiaceae bacterium]|nr:glyoxalase [Acidimicrobiaceae bacterium]
MPHPGLFPTIRCRDAKTLIDFLVEAFGFIEHFVVSDGNGIIHAEIRWPGGGAVMLGDVPGDDDHDRLDLPVGPISVYAVTDDPEGLHDRAVGAGARIVRGLRDEEYGARGFSAADPEGNIWSFATWHGED